MDTGYIVVAYLELVQTGGTGHVAVAYHDFREARSITYNEFGLAGGTGNITVAYHVFGEARGTGHVAVAYQYLEVQVTFFWLISSLPQSGGTGHVAVACHELGIT